MFDGWVEESGMRDQLAFADDVTPFLTLSVICTDDLARAIREHDEVESVLRDVPMGAIRRLTA